MDKNIVKNVLVVSGIIFVVGCGNSGGGNENKTSTSTVPSEVQDAIDAPISVLSQELTNTLSYMGNEERLAYDVYNRLYAEWGTKQFINIATKSEYKHISSVQQLIQKYKINDNIDFSNIDLPALGYMNTPIESMNAGIYDISKIQRLYDDLVAQGITSEIEALKVGCTVEVVDVNDLDRDITIAQNENAIDIVTVFNYLRDGSYNHYWAFDSGLKKQGVSAGCCTWAELCHPEYPNKENGNKNK